jgi:hypothetical protein
MDALGDYSAHADTPPPAQDRLRTSRRRVDRLGGHRPLFARCHYYRKPSARACPTAALSFPVGHSRHGGLHRPRLWRHGGNYRDHQPRAHGPAHHYSTARCRPGQPRCSREQLDTTRRGSTPRITRLAGKRRVAAGGLPQPGANETHVAGRRSFPGALSAGASATIRYRQHAQLSRVVHRAAQDRRGREWPRQQA